MIRRRIDARVRAGDGRLIARRPAIELRADIRAGDSGAPLVQDGRVAGIVFALSRVHEGVAYAVDAAVLGGCCGEPGVCVRRALRGRSGVVGAWAWPARFAGAVGAGGQARLPATPASAAKRPSSDHHTARPQCLPYANDRGYGNAACSAGSRSR